MSPSASGSLCHSSYAVEWTSSSTRPPTHSKTMTAGESTASTHSPSESSSVGVFSLLHLIPHTGRKRQLRRQCHFELGCTIVGEQLHRIDEATTVTSQTIHANPQEQLNLKEQSIRRSLSWSANRPLPLFLHAAQLSLHHPTLHGGRPLNVAAPEPIHFKQLTLDQSTHRTSSFDVYPLLRIASECVHSNRQGED
jgi:23S rRNA-/tRNA-specific pseudouridylate synthase